MQERCEASEFRLAREVGDIFSIVGADASYRMYSKTTLRYIRELKLEGLLFPYRVSVSTETLDNLRLYQEAASCGSTRSILIGHRAYPYMQLLMQRCR